jgi:phage recombination protein Bet
MSDPAGQEKQDMTATATEEQISAELTDEEQQLQATLDSAARSGEVVRYESPRAQGMLSIDPNQTDWTPVQRTALKSIGISTEGDDAVPVANVLQFLHLCQMRDLDPFLGEAHLVTYGKIKQKNNRTYDDRTFKLIVGIDGFRNRGEASGDYRGTTEPEWCGEDGVWKTMWNTKAWGNPVAARFGIFRAGFDAPVWGVTNFDEFCPMVEIWEGWGDNARRTGRFEPTPMWKKMPSNQLMKCAEAAAWRRAFPRKMSGMYAPEEMERALTEYENEKRAAAADEAQQHRMAAYAAAQERGRTEAQAVADNAPIEGEIVEDSQNRSQEPLSAAQAAQDALAAMRARSAGSPAADEPPAPLVRLKARPSDEQRLAWLVEEIRFQSEHLKQSIEELTRRQSERLGGTPYREFTADQLQLAVNQARRPTAAMLRRSGQEAEAAAYNRVPAGVAAPLWALLGHPDPDEEPVNPTKPHPYVDRGGVCRDCEMFSDDPRHGVANS